MIRHELVHQLSPGYICPFCPEREHKYPRPDNLERSVGCHQCVFQLKRILICVGMYESIILIKI